MKEIDEIVLIMNRGFQNFKSKEEIAHDILRMILARRGINI